MEKERKEGVQYSPREPLSREAGIGPSPKTPAPPVVNTGPKAKTPATKPVRPTKPYKKPYKGGGELDSLPDELAARYRSGLGRQKTK